MDFEITELIAKRDIEGRYIIKVGIEQKTEHRVYKVGSFLAGF